MQETKNMQVQSTKLVELTLAKMTKQESELVRLSQGVKTFANYNNEDKKKLAKSLVGLCYFVGIKESPSLEQLKMLVNFLTLKFGNLSLEELEKAFMTACSLAYGEIEHYQNFSPIFVAKILGFYIKEKNLAVTKYHQLNDRLMREAETLEKSKNYDHLQGAINVLMTEWRKWKKIREEEREPTDFEIAQSDIAITICKSIGLFVKYDSKKSISAHYLAKKFILLPNKQEAEVLEIISNYVRSNGKNLEY
jgi:hypothetical protein